jgi:hypothetical protein
VRSLLHCTSRSALYNDLSCTATCMTGVRAGGCRTVWLYTAPVHHPRCSSSISLSGRYSFTACEILCCELDDVLAALIGDNELMSQLFSLLDRPAPLNSTLAGALPSLCLTIPHNH